MCKTFLIVIKRKLLLCGLFLILLGCGGGLSRSEKENIQFYINLNNFNQKSKFSIDSIREVSKIRIKYIKLKPEEIQGYLSAHMKVFENDWNKPYDIKKDRFLTLEKYLEYCEANGYDPKTYMKYLN